MSFKSIISFKVKLPNGNIITKDELSSNLNIQDVHKFMMGEQLQMEYEIDDDVIQGIVTSITIKIAKIKAVK